MHAPALPNNEADRLEALKRYRVLDSDPEKAFDDLVYLASQICETEIALISLVDESRQWFKARVGLSASETDRNISFCGHAILQDEVLVVPDAKKDPRFHDNPLVTGNPNIRFYAGAPLIDPDGFKIGTVCVIDSSEKQLSAVQIECLACISRQVIGQLELRKSVHLLIDSQRNLVNAQTSVKKEAEIKAHFLAQMSHEIRTPLNGMLGLTNMLLDTNLESNQRELVRGISDSNKILLNLVNDILDTSQIDAGMLKIEHVALDLTEVAKTTLLPHSNLCQTKGIGLVVDIDKSLSMVMGDSLRISQILNNLVSNAIKFTECGAIQVKFERVKDSQLRISVADSGIGMSAEQQKKLFQRYVQADADTARKYGGTGLGLSICKKLVELMNGEISCSSEPSKGSVFWVTLPLVEVAKTSKPQEAIQISSQACFHGKILLAEDNAINQKVALAFFKKLGLTVKVAENGRKAVTLWAEEEFDMIFMDGHMPELDGLAATLEIRQAEAAKGCKPIPIIAFTADVISKEVEICKKMGMNDFLPKPFELQRLKDILIKWLPTESILDSKQSKPVPGQVV